MLAGGHGMGDAVRYCPRLACARTREDRDRSVERLRRGALLVVESIQGEHGCDAVTSA